MFTSKAGACPILLILVTLLAGEAGGQTVLRVDTDAPNDPGPNDPLVSDPAEDGSAAHPFDSIQEAINASQSGDTILILSGEYTGVGNRDLDFAGRNITVLGESGPDYCVVDCESAGRGFYFHSGETNAAVVEGTHDLPRSHQRW